MSNKRQLTTRAVEQILKQFATTGELETKLNPSDLFREIYESWRRFGGETLLVSGDRGGRKGRSIRRRYARLHGKYVDTIPNLIGKVAGRAQFTTADISRLLGLMFQTWSADDLVEESTFSELIGHEAALAELLCPTGKKLFLPSPHNHLVKRAVACRVVSDVSMVTQTFMTGSADLEIEGHSPLGTIKAKFSIKTIFFRERNLIEVVAIREGKEYHIVFKACTQEGFVVRSKRYIGIYRKQVQSSK